MKKNQDSAVPPQDDARNLSKLNRNAFIWQVAAALISGGLLSTAFPPLNWNLAVWVSLVPVLLMPTPRGVLQRMAVGYVLGYTHFAIVLHWLNEVGFGAGWLLSLYCALFPMLWYTLLSSVNWQFKDKLTLAFPGAGPLFHDSQAKHIATALFGALLWAALEYLRSWFLTGFPWDFLGISQYQRPVVSALAEYTGVYGISFAIVLVNGVVASEAALQLRFLIAPRKRSIPWHFTLFLLVLVPFCLLPQRPKAEAPADSPTLRILAVQGNLPLCRVWTQEQFQSALNTYLGMTRNAVAEFPDADLVLWPECAVPTPDDYLPYRTELVKLLLDTGKPLLYGSLRETVQADGQVSAVFNSVILRDGKSQIKDIYDKTHRVPFGEYTPFGDQFPWLRKLIGMGRDLTPGRELRLFSLPKGAHAGVAICFEDAFPEISRSFTRQGATLLMTVTNDSWYGKSCGAEQHASHVIFRAIENRRPVLRSGNNSHTCLISPDGQVLGQIKSEDGFPFVKGYQAYDVPISNAWGETFYTRHGDVFAKAVSVLALLALLALAIRKLLVKNKQLSAIAKH